MAFYVRDTRLLSCPHCREPVIVTVDNGGSVASNQRCLECGSDGEEFRVKSSTVRARLDALAGVMPPLHSLEADQVHQLAELAAARGLKIAAARDLAAAK